MLIFWHDPTTGVVVKTHKPVSYQGIDLANKMTDRNNDMKFAFLSQETVPDYRTLDVSFFCLIYM